MSSIQIPEAPEKENPRQSKLLTYSNVGHADLDQELVRFGKLFFNSKTHLSGLKWKELIPERMEYKDIRPLFCSAIGVGSFILKDAFPEPSGSFFYRC